MARLRARTGRAAALHREAAAMVTGAEAALDAVVPAGADRGEQHELADGLRAAAAELAPGWLGQSLQAPPADVSLGGPVAPGFVRIGTACLSDDASFPVIVPLLGTGHLAIDRDSRDPRVAGLVRGLLVRLLAAAPAGSLLVRAVDDAGRGATFAAFAPLADAGLLPPPAIDHTGLRATLSEAEHWIRSARSTGGRRPRPERSLLLVIASLPEPTDAADLARIGGLAEDGPAAGLHLIVAGWPPRPLAGETAQPVLVHTTSVLLRHPYALVGDPPGGRYSVGDDRPHRSGLNAPVFLDPDPPAGLVDRVCRELAARPDSTVRPELTELLADGPELWRHDPAHGLATIVGYDRNTPLTLRLNDLTPHWMIGGRPGAGKSTFLGNVLYGLGTRYSPDDLELYLLDCADSAAFGEFLPTEPDRSWLPHIRAAGVACDREYGLDVLRELDAEMTRRSAACERAGVTRYAGLRREQPLPRILCVIDEFPLMLSGGDRLAAEAASRLSSVARNGRSYGIHLILASLTPTGLEAQYAGRDSIFGQFPVRVALPGGGDLLDPTNDAAAGLPLGTAVVNTAGGLGGPRGATRGHERTIRFPDPRADDATVADVRHRLWTARSPEAAPPPVFAGHRHQHLADDPVFQARRSGRRGRPAALVGRVIDVRLSTAAFPFNASTGRHLAVVGPSDGGGEVLEAAALSLAAHHPPGTARFAVCSLAAGTDDQAKSLAAELTETQRVELVAADDLPAALAAERPGYLVVFGMDASTGGTVPDDRLVSLLRDGPSKGVHLLASWAAARRFAEMIGGVASDAVAGMVLLDVPAGEASELLGQAVQWQPRPNRALFCDRHAGRTSVIVPFVRAERTA